jgi:hypothetical protein
LPLDRGQAAVSHAGDTASEMAGMATQQVKTFASDSTGVVSTFADTECGDGYFVRESDLLPNGSGRKI